MGKEAKNILAMDSNKWIMLVEELEQDSAKWVCYLKEHNFEVIMPDIVAGEILALLSRKEGTKIYQERKTHFLRLIKSGQNFEFKHIKTKHEEDYYYRKAEMLMKKHRLHELQKSNGLCQSIDGKEIYALHKQDLAIFISLKEIGKPYYFITHDNGLRDALEIAEIRKALVEEGICFILLHETQILKNRQIRRIKVMPEY